MFSPTASEFKYYIGLDLGTSRTGWSYAAKAHPHRDRTGVHLIDSYPQQPAPYHKTLSCLLYDNLHHLPTPLDWGWPARNRYLELAPKEERDRRYILLQNFKLSLLPDLGSDYALPAGLTPAKVVTDFLTFLLRHIQATLAVTYNGSWRPTMTRWCMTVPAEMGQRFIAILRQALTDAYARVFDGLVLQRDSVMFSYEPEAAALAVKHRMDVEWVAGARTMIIDGGGGTVDLTIHETVVLPGSDSGQLGLSEATCRKCLLQGGTVMDAAFEAHMASVLGGEYEEWRSNPANGRDYQEFLAAWELVKCAHTADPAGAEAATILLPESLQEQLSAQTTDWLEEQHGGAYKLELAAATMDAFFDASLEPVIVVAEQMINRVDDSVQRIMLVGGLAASPYVVAKLRAALQRWDRQLLAPAYGYAAVLEGAALYARYPAAIDARRSAMTYGIRTGVRWRPGAPDKVFVGNRPDPGYFTFQGFSKYVSRGELIHSGSTVTHTFYPMVFNQAYVQFDIYGSTSLAPRHTSEGGMQKITTVTVDIELGEGEPPDDNPVTALMQFGEALIDVKVVDLKTKREVATVMLFGSEELLPCTSLGQGA